MTTFNTNTFHRGKLRYVATFQNPVFANDGAGGRVVTSFTTIYTTRCQLVFGNGMEVLGTGMIYYAEDYIMRCGWRPSSYVSITTDTIILIHGPGYVTQTFKIKRFSPIDMKSHIYEFALQAGVKSN